MEEKAPAPSLSSLWFDCTWEFFFSKPAEA